MLNICGIDYCKNCKMVGKNCFKYFAGYKDGKKVRPLCVMLPKMSAYRRNFDEIKYMSF